MEEDFQDMVEQVNGIAKRLDELNGDFFSKIFKDTLREELKSVGENQTGKVIAYIEKFLKNEIKDHCSHHKETKEVQTEKTFLE